MPKKSEDLSGQTFGVWNVIKKNGKSKNGHALYMCECQCGTIKDVVGPNLKHGKSVSCGCLNSFSHRLLNKGFRTRDGYIKVNLY